MHTVVADKKIVVGDREYALAPILAEKAAIEGEIAQKRPALLRGLGRPNRQGYEKRIIRQGARIARLGVIGLRLAVINDLLEKGRPA